MPRVHLVSYADLAFARRGPVFQAQAESLGVFDTVQVYRQADLPADFLAKHSAFMDDRRNARGHGYWIWKPVVVQEALRAAASTDFIVYLDAGFTLNPVGAGRMRQYIEIAAASPWRMLSFMNIHTESTWNKRDLRLRLGVDERPEITETSQLTSGFVVMQPTASNLDLVDQWARLATEEGCRFSDDSPSVAPNVPGFREHRHDQSIFSLLRKVRGTSVTFYEVQDYANHLPKMRDVVPAWATRARE